MSIAIHPEAPPLSQESTGAIRVGNSRVLLELVIHAFQDGATLEAIVQRYSTLALPDVYSVIAYYLRHPREINAYLERREAQADSIRKKIEATQPDMNGIRSRLIARRGL